MINANIQKVFDTFDISCESPINQYDSLDFSNIDMPTTRMVTKEHDSPVLVSRYYSEDKFNNLQERKQSPLKAWLKIEKQSNQYMDIVDDKLK